MCLIALFLRSLNLQEEVDFVMGLIERLMRENVDEYERYLNLQRRSVALV